MKKIIVLLISILLVSGCGKVETKEHIISKGLENLKSTNFINYCEGNTIDSLGDKISISNLSIDKENNILYNFNEEILKFNSSEKDSVEVYVRNQNGTSYKMEMDFSKMDKNIITLVLYDSEKYIVAYDTLECSSKEYYQK